MNQSCYHSDSSHIANASTSCFQTGFERHHSSLIHLPSRIQVLTNEKQCGADAEDDWDTSHFNGRRKVVSKKSFSWWLGLEIRQQHPSLRALVSHSTICMIEIQHIRVCNRNCLDQLIHQPSPFDSSSLPRVLPRIAFRWRYTKCYGSLVSP